MEVTYQLTRNDLIAGSLHALDHDPATRSAWLRARRLVAAMVVLIVVFAGVLAWPRYLRARAYTQSRGGSVSVAYVLRPALAAAGVPLAFVAVLYPLMLSRRAFAGRMTAITLRVHRRAGVDTSNMIRTLQVGDDGVTWSSGHSHLLCTWAGLREIAETPTHLFLYRRETPGAIVVPMRAFAEAEDAEAVVARIREGIDDAASPR